MSAELSERTRQLRASALFHADRAVRLLPAPGRALAKSARHAIDPPLVALYRRRSSDTSPMPPSSVRLRAGAVGIGPYLGGGEAHARDLVSVLETSGHSLQDFHAVLDFGCGAGRVLRHLIPRVADSTRCVGTDVDAEAIAWAQSHLTGASFLRNGFVPPLPLYPESFDLVYSYSVFTHLDEAGQFAWLAELRRVARPGALVLLSVHGPGAYELFATRRLVSHARSCARRIGGHGDLGREGIVFEPYEISRWDRRDFPGVGTFGMTFHDPGYVREHWSRWFEVLDIVPTAVGLHDMVVLRRS